MMSCHFKCDFKKKVLAVYHITSNSSREYWWSITVSFRSQKTTPDLTEDFFLSFSQPYGILVKNLTSILLTKLLLSLNPSKMCTDKGLHIFTYLNDWANLLVVVFLSWNLNTIQKWLVTLAIDPHMIYFVEQGWHWI